MQLLDSSVAESSVSLAAFPSFSRKEPDFRRQDFSCIAPHTSETLLCCSTLTMKQFRALLEEDMGLPEKSLRENKEAIEEMVDQVSAG